MPEIKLLFRPTPILSWVFVLDGMRILNNFNNGLVTLENAEASFEMLHSEQRLEVVYGLEAL